MALSGPVVIQPDDLVNGDGTLRRALELWSCRHGPVQYNQWQSAFFALLRSPNVVDDEAPADESSSARQKRIREWHDQIQEANHGPDHLAQALLAAAARTAAESEERVGTIGAGSLLAHERGLQVVGHEASRAATSLVSNPLAAYHDMSTPRGDGGAESIIGSDSPDRTLHLPGAEEVWNEETGTHTEATVEEEERLERLAQGMSLVEGSDTAGIEFMIRVEQLIPEYREAYGAWKAHNPVTRGSVSLKEYCTNCLLDLDADRFADSEELKRHVYALGKLADVPRRKSRAFAKKLWMTSKNATPVTGASPGIFASPPSAPAGFAVTPGQTPGQTPGGAASRAEMVNVVEGMQRGFGQMMEQQQRVSADLAAKLLEKGSSDGLELTSDRFQTISGLDFKRPSPSIKDDDPDLDSHDRAFENMVACYAFGRKKLRDVDKLHMYAGSFKEGTTRRKVFDNALRKATTKGRIPAEAAKVLGEIREELRTFIWETPMQKVVRLDKEFEALEQGGLSHADFRALWDAKLQDMEESGMDMPTETTLYRKYLTKLSPGLRMQVISKDWKIDGPDKPPRMVKTYQDIARAVGLALEEKADIHATGHAGYDSLMNLDGSPTHRGVTSRRGAAGGAGNGGGPQCRHCGMGDLLGVRGMQPFAEGMALGYCAASLHGGIVHHDA